MTGINVFLTGKSVLIVMVLILTNKDVFETSYNDLKFMVENCNYICTNLVSPLSKLPEFWSSLPSTGSERLPTPVFLPGEFDRLYSPWGRKESDMAEATFIALFPLVTTSLFSLSMSLLLFLLYSLVCCVF